MSTLGRRHGVCRSRSLRDERAQGIRDLHPRHVAHVLPSTYHQRARVPEILESVAEAAHGCSVHIHATAVLTEHVHVIASLKPDATISSFIRHAKSESARRLNSARSPFKWARGYYVATMSREDVSTHCAYVARQFQRHPDLIPE